MKYMSIAKVFGGAAVFTLLAVAVHPLPTSAQAPQNREAAPCTSGPSQSDFVGKWEAGQGNGQGVFITLDANGEAWKSTGPGAGNWKWVDGEARITWDDGWHDVIIKRGSGSRYLKLGYEPGRTFEGIPSNVAPARNSGPVK